MKNGILRSVVVLLLLGSSWGTAFSNDRKAQEMAELVGELREALEETGSFQARYRIVSDSEVEIDLWRDVERGQTTLRFRGIESQDEVVIGETRRGENDVLEFRIAEGEEGQKIMLAPGSFEEVLGALLRMISELLAIVGEEAVAEPEIFALRIADTLTLAVDEESVSVFLGFRIVSDEAEGMQVSWIDEGLFSEAVELTRSEEEWVLVFANGRRLAIDPASGLVVSDIIPDPANPESELRWIRLEEFSSYGRERLPEKRFPDISQVRFEEVDARRLIANLTEEFTREVLNQFLVETAPMLKDLETLRHELAENQDEIAAHLRRRGREMALEKGVQVISDDELEAIVENAFIPMYKMYHEVDEAEAISFNEFIDKMIGQQMGESIDFPEAEALEREIRRQSQQIFAAATPELRESLQLLLGMAVSHLVEGWSIGMLQGILERAKDSEAAQRLVRERD